MIVEVRPLPNKKWHQKEGKESFARPKDLEVLFDPQTGRYATGLTEEEAAKYGKELGGVDLSDTFNYNEPHPYWSTKAATIRLENHTQLFDTSRPADYVKVKNMKASKLVANSMKEAEDGKWPEATHVIFDEEEQVNIRATKIAVRDQAIVMKMKMSDEDKANLAVILNNRSIRGRSPDYINVEIDAIIEEKPGEFLRIANMGRQEVYIRAVILECLLKNILTRESGIIHYMGEAIAPDYESAVQWFKDPQNSRMKTLILEKITNVK